MYTDEKIAKLQQIIDDGKRIVFFGGAGVSTESGIPDFRSADGLYNSRYKYPPEYMLSHTCYKVNPADFYDFYKDKILCCMDCVPNAAHYKLAELEAKGKLLSVVTQNIDGLHQKAGSKRVWELHGSVLRNYCLSCGQVFSADYIRTYKGVPKCGCGGAIKPDVVLYEEALDCATVDGAIKDIASADVMIVGGTSLAVYPAAGFLDYFSGEKLVVINKTDTTLSNKADLVIKDSIGKILQGVEVR